MADMVKTDLHEQLGKPVSVLSKGAGSPEQLTVASVDQAAEVGFSVDAAVLSLPEYQRLWQKECASIEDPRERTLAAMRLAERLGAKKTASSASDANGRKQKKVARKRTDAVEDPAEATSAIAELTKLLRAVLIDNTTVAAAELKTVRKMEEPAVVQDVFAQLGIPGLGAVARKPEFKVEFNLGELGRMQARYHWVGVHNDCVFLVYDTRFEYGMLFEPPVLGTERPLRIKIVADGGHKEFSVVSVDLLHPFGVFYIISLPIVAAESDAQPTDMFQMPVPANSYDSLGGNDNGF